MLTNSVLALGLALSPASQLRLAGLPVGPSELCLVLWVGLASLAFVLRLQESHGTVFNSLLLFWTLFGLSLLLGTLTGYVIGDLHDSGLFIHDAVAYPLLAAVSLLSVVEPNSLARTNEVARLVVVFGTLLLAVQIFQALTGFELFDLDPWYWDRLRGWSDNPNQLALVCGILAPLAIHVGETSRHPMAFAGSLLSFFVIVSAGFMTKSDTFRLALIGVLAIYTLLKLRTWSQLRQSSLNFKAAVAWIAFLALPAIAASGGAVVASLGEGVFGIAKSLAKEGGKVQSAEADLRFLVWREAINRGLESGMLGLGPGPHIAIPASIIAARRHEGNEPKYVEHPEVTDAPNFEAHNTLLDLFTQGGLLALVALSWLAAKSLKLAYRAKQEAQLAMLAGLIIFSVFHLIVRHPLFWFAIGFSLVGSYARIELMTTGERR